MTHVDVAIVGAGMAGMYAAHRFAELGFTLQGFEAGSSVGGVWFHNRYPGARVDVESLSYSYFFSRDLYREWTWSERLAAQPEILAYLDHVADRFGIRERFRFDTRVTSATWDPELGAYHVVTDRGEPTTAQFLVMATGQLSAPRRPAFAGLDDFEGTWLQTAQWPRDAPDLAGKRIAVIGTGSSGTQVVPALAPIAGHLTVFQRTANYGIPTQNGPIDPAQHAAIVDRLDEVFDELVHSPSGMLAEPPAGPALEFTAEERLALLERRWAMGGQNMNMVFRDQGINQWTNDLVSEFVREKVRQIVVDPVVAGILLPREYPIGTRRLAVNTGFYEAFNRDNVSVVDIKADPIESITSTGLRTRRRHFELDVIVFALGFEAFTGSIDQAGIRNAEGAGPTDHWSRGPRTHLGLMTSGFPNLLFMTGAGSPSVLANFFVQSCYQADLMGELMTLVRDRGCRTVATTVEAEESWSEHVDEVAKPLLRRYSPNYMVHVDRTDGSRRFIPWAGGLGSYVDEVDAVIADGWRGFVFA